MNRTRVLLADDHPLFLAALRALVEAECDVVGAVSDGRALMEAASRLKPDVIVATTTPGAVAAKQATATIPIVGVNLTDPVGFGLVTSEAHPRTNVTGILFGLEGLTKKQVEIALDLMPGANSMGILVDVNNPSNMLQRREVEAPPGSWE